MKKTFASALALVVCASFMLATSGAANAATASASVRLSSLDRALLVQINAEREARNLSPLKLSSALSDVADDHTAEMGRSGYFSHDSLDQTPASARIEKSYPSAGARAPLVSENLLYAWPSVSAAAAIELWMESPGHRANILNPVWREIGIAARHSATAPGIYGGHPVTIITTDFGTRQ